MKFFQANALSLTCLVAMIGIGLVMYPSLPESLPTQYGLGGDPRNYLPKQFVILLMPFAYACTIAVIQFMIRFSPEKFAMRNSQRAVATTVLSIGILFLSIHLSILIGQGNSEVFQQYFSIGFSCFLILMGNVIGKTERNFVLGIRLPWTLASEKNWRATHRLAGRLMVVSGLLLFFVSFFWLSISLILVLGLAWLLIASIYSFLFFLKKERPTSE